MACGEAHGLPDRIDGLSRPRDLDLLVFLARHPRSLLSIEALASFLGGDPSAIAESLDALCAAGVLARTPHAAATARLYVLDCTSPRGDELRAVLDRASTRDGWLTLRALHASRGRRHEPAARVIPASPPDPRGVARRTLADLPRIRTG
jgi:hypothetical protein